MLADNIVVLKKEMPEFYNSMKNWENKNLSNFFSIEKARDGSLTLKYQKENRIIYVHSKYKPLIEAQTFIEQFDQNEIKSCDHIIFFGIGLGYHIDYFLKSYPDIKFSIIEPSFEIMSQYLNNRNVTDLFRSKLVEFTVGESREAFFRYISSSHDNKMKILELPVYDKLFPEEYTDFLQIFNQVLTNEKRNMAVGLATQKRWISNCVNNFKWVLKTPNILLENNESFLKKTAIIVAAGPSLNDEIENLKIIKDQGLAFIFSVGSAINALLENGIYPDAMCTYDPYEANQQVFKKVNELELDSIPMIFGSSVGYEVLEKYKGQKIHMLMNVDLISIYFLDLKDGKEIELFNDAPSIANVTIELLDRLGFDRIVLVGQNLGYLNDKNYADGIDYAAERKSKVEKTKEIEDVFGNMIETNDMFLSMKENMELLIKRIKTPVINTTRGGAKIEGTEFFSLTLLIENVLVERIVNGDELKNINIENAYDKPFMKEQLKNMMGHYLEYNKLLSEIKQFLSRLDNLFNSNNTQEIIETHNRMNKKIVEMENNDFFKLFGESMNRVVFKRVIDKIETLKKEKNELKRIKALYKPMKDLIDQLLASHESYKLLLKELDETISTYVSN